jgi:hypothetical protein
MGSCFWSCFADGRTNNGDRRTNRKSTEEKARKDNEAKKTTGKEEGKSGREHQTAEAANDRA